MPTIVKHSTIPSINNSIPKMVSRVGPNGFLSFVYLYIKYSIPNKTTEIINVTIFPLPAAKFTTAVPTENACKTPKIMQPFF